MRLLHLLPISLVLTLTQVGCDKPKQLDAENAQLIQQRNQLLKELEDYEQRIRAVGNASGYGSTDMIKQRAQEISAKALAAKSAAEDKLLKWTRIETQFNALRLKVEAYKAKNLK